MVIVKEHIVAQTNQNGANTFTSFLRVFETDAGRYFHANGRNTGYVEMGDVEFNALKKGSN